MMTLTDALIREVEALRPVIDRASGKAGVQIRAILDHGTVRVTASVKQYEERA